MASGSPPGDRRARQELRELEKDLVVSELLMAWGDCALVDSEGEDCRASRCAGSESPPDAPLGPLPSPLDA